MSAEEPQGTEIVRIAFACPHCAERVVMTPEQTMRFARGLLAQAAGLEPVELDVRGSG